MKHRIEEDWNTLKKINEEYVGWYMFIKAGLQPGKGIHYAFSKNKVSAKGVREVVLFLKQNTKTFHLVRRHVRHREYRDYFVYQIKADTTQVRMLVLVICGESLVHTERMVLDKFLCSQTNTENQKRYSQARTLRDGDLFKINLKGTGKVHKTEPAHTLDADDDEYEEG